MLKKRLIFTLLYSEGQFMLSRNFRLQKVGSLNWLQTNYNFSHISYSIDELIVLDVTRGEKNLDRFCSDLQKLTEGCFVPIAAGGGVRSVDIARKLLRSGADKVVVNSVLYDKNGFISALASEFGQQSIVASVDIKRRSDGEYNVWSNSGALLIEGYVKDLIYEVTQNQVGEIYLNSIDRDGTGHGYDLNLLNFLPNDTSKPIILAGGVGNASHLASGLADSRVDAAATANLFNFVGNGLQKARESLISNGVDLPLWDVKLLQQHLNGGPLECSLND
jgi:cyclase